MLVVAGTAVQQWNWRKKNIYGTVSPARIILTVTVNLKAPPYITKIFSDPIMSREEIIRSSDPRTDALNYVTKNGRYTLQVEEFIEAGRPDGTESHSSYVTRHTTPNV